ncbi:hypothetical protein Y032_0029g1847 [Ancylostoma ceylanicum]|uniref:Uncharacterized protein n=1 Tax=Ancylostoma ceylanicum TaxID=53326 RepID=A0A016UTC7_9BILA|nr:hypothetical protein Y032_0029g1847 [Ancylostoma ceylanicum]
MRTPLLNLGSLSAAFYRSLSPQQLKRKCPERSLADNSFPSLMLRPMSSFEVFSSFPMSAHPLDPIVYCTPFPFVVS